MTERTSAVNRVQGSLIQGIGSGARGPLQNGALVYVFLRQRFVLIHTNRIARIQNARIAYAEKVAHFHLAFFIQYQGRPVLVLDFHIEDRSPYRNHGAGCPNLIVVRKPARMFDLNANFAQPDLQHVFPVAAIGAKYHVGFGKDFEFTAVGYLKYSVAFVASHDYLLRLDQVPYIQRPGRVIPQKGNLPGEGQQLGRTANVKHLALRVHSRCVPKHTPGQHSGGQSSSAEKISHLGHYEITE